MYPSSTPGALESILQNLLRPLRCTRSVASLIRLLAFLPQTIRRPIFGRENSIRNLFSLNFWRSYYPASFESFAGFGSNFIGESLVYRPGKHVPGSVNVLTPTFFGLRSRKYNETLFVRSFTRGIVANLINQCNSQRVCACRF